MLKDIVSISGQGGLFKFVSQAKNCVIVESLNDSKRFPVYTSTKVNSLEDIAIFTEEKEIPLKDIFKKVSEKENQQKCIDSKASSNEELKIYFAEILPEYDRDRVYVSDIKKVLNWYNILHDLKLLKFEEEKEKPEQEESKNSSQDEVVKESTSAKKTPVTKKPTKKSPPDKQAK